MPHEKIDAATTELSNYLLLSHCAQKLHGLFLRRLLFFIELEKASGSTGIVATIAGHAFSLPPVSLYPSFDKPGFSNQWAGHGNLTGLTGLTGLTCPTCLTFANEELNFRTFLKKIIYAIKRGLIFKENLIYTYSVLNTIQI